VRDFGLAGNGVSAKQVPIRRSEAMHMYGAFGTPASHSQEVSTIEVVTFSGVISGGMVTSGTTCWTWNRGQHSL
jgi:hypothetical protein